MDWLILTLSSAFLLALSTLFQKNVLNKEHSLEFTISMYGFTCLILLPNLFFLDYSALSLKLLALISFRAILIAGGFLMFIKSLKRAELSLVAPISNLSSIGVIMIGILFMGDKMSFLQFAGISLIIMGTYALQLDKKHSFFEPFRRLRESKQMHYSILSIVFFSFSSPLTKHIFNNYTISALDYMHISFIVGFIALILYYGFIGQPYMDIWKDARKVGIIIPIISLLDLASMYTYISAVAIPTAMISLIIPIRRLSTLMDVLFAGKMLHESDIMKKAVSTTVILAGIIFLVL